MTWPWAFVIVGLALVYVLGRVGMAFAKIWLAKPTHTVSADYFDEPVNEE